MSRRFRTNLDIVAASKMYLVPDCHVWVGSTAELTPIRNGETFGANRPTRPRSIPGDLRTHAAYRIAGRLGRGVAAAPVGTPVAGPELGLRPPVDDWK